MSVAHFLHVSRACNTTMSERDQKTQNTTTILSLPGSHLIRYLGCKMQPKRHEARPASRSWRSIRNGAFSRDSHATSKIPGSLIFFNMPQEGDMCRFPKRSDTSSDHPRCLKLPRFESPVTVWGRRRSRFRNISGLSLWPASNRISRPCLLGDRSRPVRIAFTLNYTGKAHEFE